MTMQAIIPMLAYEDGIAALEWLVKAFGFTERKEMRMIDDNGRLSHGELELDNNMIMLATPTPDYESPARHRQHCEQARKWSQVPWIINGLLVYVSDVDAHYDRAKNAGAVILSPPEDGFPGRRYRCEDLEGQRWMFMQREQ